MLWVEPCAVLMTINQPKTVDRFTMLSIRNENITKIDKLYNYMFESTLNAKRLCLRMFKLRVGFCVMVKYETSDNISG